jgi:hypothetical protein
MNTIEAAVANIPFEKEPCQYTAEGIADAELLTGKPFPNDFKWYLLNIGWQKIAYDHRSILIPNEEYIYTLQFEGVEHQTFSINRYKQYLESNTAELLPYDKRLYYPFGKIAGEINPSVSFQLLISMNQENYGSVWTAKLKIADSFTLFLTQIGQNNRLKPIAAKNNEALFLRFLTLPPDILPTTAPDPEQLITAQQLIVNGLRNVEFQHYDNDLRLENEQKFIERVDAFAKMSFKTLQRKNIKIGAPELYTGSDYFKWNEHHYYIVPVESSVGDNYLLKESFLLYQGEQWSMVRRYSSAIDEVKIKGVGTFTFDDTYKWELKKKITPAWSESPAGLYVEGEEDALSGEVITFIKAILANADFKSVLEAYVLNYGGAACNNYNIYIKSDHEFHIHMDSPWDEEHGLTVKVRDWKIQ